MIESPLLDDLKVLFRQMATLDNILDVLDVRFGGVPADVSEAVRAIKNDRRLHELHRLAVTCADLYGFRSQLSVSPE